MKKGNNLKPFKKGQSGNPKGRPKKTFTKFMEEIKEEGYELVSRAMFTEAIDALLGLDEKKLADIIKDMERPMTLRIVARAMLEKNGVAILEKLLNRSHGMPTKQIQNTPVEDNYIDIEKYKTMSMEELNRELNRMLDT